eukprot:TRINITY_DN36869_c0_g1_i1.p1 TRINITY_DN36869_c0_g1~~TRINITY_DN36869_c0_g1_i1.p1  ORF type:complete len:863 (-),score=120.68 TRINITY_DN36869_c0_g1_i1:207-2753(-)
MAESPENGTEEEKAAKRIELIKEVKKKFGETPTAPPLQAVSPEEGSADFEELFRHGEIYFEETMTVAKYLCVQDQLSNPEELIRLIMGSKFWNLPLPQLIIESLEAEGTVYWNYGDIEDKSVWHEDEKTGMGLYFDKLGEITYGVLRAATECDGWVILGEHSNMGGPSDGKVWKYGYDQYVARTGGMSSSKSVVLAPVNGAQFETAARSAHALEKSKKEDGSDIKELRKQLSYEFDFKYRFPSEIDLWSNGVGIREKVKKRVTWPNQERFYHGWSDEVNSTLCYPGPMEELPYSCLNPHGTHFIFHNNSPAVSKMLRMLPSIVPSVTVMIGAFSPADMQRGLDDTKKLFNKAQSGGQVVVLKHAGLWSTKLANALDPEKGDDMVSVPEGARLRNFVVLDMVKDSADRVITRLTKALSNVSTDEILELGFEGSETQRLMRAWRLCVQYMTMARRQYWLSMALFVLITTVGLVTQVVAVLYNGDVEFEHNVRSWLRVGCGTLPLLSTFLISVNQRFSPHAKHASLECAACFIRCEIYRYRARVTDYAARSAGARISQILSSQKSPTSKVPETSIEKDAEGQKESPGKSGLKQVLRAQTVFSVNIDAINRDLMASEVRVDALQSVSKETVQSELDSLYPGHAARAKVPGSLCCRICSEDIHEDEEDPSMGDVSSAIGGTARLLGAQEEVGDNGVSALSADDYVKFRQAPLIRQYAKQSPILARQVYMLYLLIFCTTALSSLLTFLKYEMWIPVVVSTSAALSTIMDFTNAQTRLRNNNKALADLHGLTLWWDGLSLMNKRMAKYKETLVDVTESIVQQELGATFNPSKQNQKTDDGEDDEADEEQRKNKEK